MRTLSDRFAFRLAVFVAAACLAHAGAAGAREFVESNGVQEFTPEEVMQILIWGDEHSPLVVDSRPRIKFVEGHVPGARSVDSKETWGRLEELRQYQNRGLIFYDLKGLASRVPTQALLREGFRKIGIMQGHFVEWQRLGYPVAVEPVAVAPVTVGSGSE